MVKVNRSDLLDILSSGADVEILVTGEMADGIPFEAADAIRVK